MKQVNATGVDEWKVAEKAVDTLRTLENDRKAEVCHLKREQLEIVEDRIRRILTHKENENIHFKSFETPNGWTMKVWANSSSYGV